MLADAATLPTLQSLHNELRLSRRNCSSCSVIVTFKQTALNCIANLITTTLVALVKVIIQLCWTAIARNCCHCLCHSCRSRTSGTWGSVGQAKGLHPQNSGRPQCTLAVITLFATKFSPVSCRWWNWNCTLNTIEGWTCRWSGVSIYLRTTIDAVCEYPRSSTRRKCDSCFVFASSFWRRHMARLWRLPSTWASGCVRHRCFFISRQWNLCISVIDRSWGVCNRCSWAGSNVFSNLSRRIRSDSVPLPPVTARKAAVRVRSSEWTAASSFSLFSAPEYAIPLIRPLLPAAGATLPKVWGLWAKAAPFKFETVWSIVIPPFVLAGLLGTLALSSMLLPKGPILLLLLLTLIVSCAYHTQNGEFQAAQSNPLLSIKWDIQSHEKGWVAIEIQFKNRVLHRTLHTYKVEIHVGKLHQKPCPFLPFPLNPRTDDWEKTKLGQFNGEQTPADQPFKCFLQVSSSEPQMIVCALYKTLFAQSCHYGYSQRCSTWHCSNPLALLPLLSKRATRSVHIFSIACSFRVCNTRFNDEEQPSKQNATNLKMRTANPAWIYKDYIRLIALFWHVSLIQSLTFDSRTAPPPPGSSNRNPYSIAAN